MVRIMSDSRSWYNQTNQKRNNRSIYWAPMWTLCLTQYICYWINPLTREVDIISPDLEVFHSSHEPFPFLTKLFQAPLLKLEYLVLTHYHQTHWVTGELLGHFPCEIFPDLCCLPDLETVYPTLCFRLPELHLSLNYKASLYACLPSVHCQSF